MGYSKELTSRRVHSPKGFDHAKMCAIDSLWGGKALGPSYRAPAPICVARFSTERTVRNLTLFRGPDLHR
jgi:hypothetical protein